MWRGKRGNMRRKDKLPELLAPAGDMDCLIAAVRGGADAVYLGARSFGARAYAKNFEIDELSRAVIYCHAHGVRVYVAMNTLLTDAELTEATALATTLYSIGVDALIVADLGLVRRLRRELPEMELHASTQMSVHNTAGADEAYRLGCVRVVLAREVSGKNIKRITENCLAETEVFLHGALCVCHSGQCLFSSLVGGRSGNRGECAQPCRLPYSGGYPLSLTDLSLADHIPALIESGTASLKIEGRMKSPDYVYTVTSIYRSLLDENRVPTENEKRRLLRAFSRGGFTDGYYTEKIESKSMLGVRSQDDKAASREDRENIEKEVITPTRVKISAICEIKADKPAELTLVYNTKGGETVRATAIGDTPDVARSQPLSVDGVKSRLCKMGGTFFSLEADDVLLTLDDGLNLSPASINALRRNAVSELEGKIALLRPKNPKTDLEDIHKCNMAEGITNLDGLKHSAVFYDTDVLSSLKKELEYFDVVFLPLWKYADACVKVNGVALPPVVMESEVDEVLSLCENAVQLGAKYALVGNLGHLSMCEKAGLIPISDFRFNITNIDTGTVVSALGVNNCLLSPELTAPAVRKLSLPAIVYGRIPLMLTERCFMRDSFGCKSCSECSLTDRKGTKFPMIREYRHRNLILNSAITYMGDRQGEIRGIPSHHFIFTNENADEIRAVISAFRRGDAFPLSYQMRRMGRRDAAKS